MKESDNTHLQQWTENPEPNKTELDGSIILDLDAVSDAYLWASKNCKEGWLSYNGPVIDIEQ
jgi:hypothetical protein